MTQEELRHALAERCIEYEWRRADMAFGLTHKTNSKGPYIEIDISNSYTAPKITLSVLFFLSEVFGTKDIDVDDYAHSGCETCDWGSSYGHTIQIYNATKMLD